MDNFKNGYMKIIGIQIKSNEAILVVLEKEEGGNVIQTNESIKFDIKDTSSAAQVKQFRDQVNATFDTIRPDKIVVVARNAKAKGRMAPSPMSFKLEGIIQLYDKIEINFIWPQTVLAFMKKQKNTLTSTHVYQQDAFNLAFYALNFN